MASCPEASWKRTLMSFGQRHEVFWFSDFAAKSCAIHQVVRFGAFSQEGMKNSHLVSSFSTLDLQSGIRKCYRMQPFHSAQHRSPAVGWVAPSLTRQRLAGCFVGATLHRPRLQGSKAKICLKKKRKNNLSAHDWAAHRRCSAHHLGLQCWSLLRNHPRLKGAFRRRKGDLLTSRLRHF